MRPDTMLHAIACAVLFAAACLAPDAPAAEPAGKADPGAETRVPVPERMAKQIPPPRTKAELADVLKGADEKAPTRPIHVVLVAGKKDHGPGEHDYPAWQKAWAALLAKAPKTKVTTARGKPSAEDFKSADVMVLSKHMAWPKALNEQVEKYFDRGGGMVLLHYAVDAGANPKSVGKHIGLTWGGGCRYRHGWVELSFPDKLDCPILRGFAGRKVRFHDESYWRLHGDASRIQVLATGQEKEKQGTVTIPLLWNRRSGKGRVHVNILGHYNWTFNDPLFRVLLLRAIAWAAKEPVDRFNGLVPVGVTWKD